MYMGDQKEECFIIMPITTPEPMREKYRDGEDHFKHVLECLFIPAIEKAGYKPIPPKAEGSDLIQAEIIKNLETAAIVLCDVSCLNPNVFFEFGIRTSLNKPVCIVKDELTKTVPFDTSILNHKEYKSTLEPWHLEDEIGIISDHLTASVERSKGENTLWKYFGFKSEAEPYKVVEAGTEGKLDYLAMQIDSMQKMINHLSATPATLATSAISNIYKNVTSAVSNDTDNLITINEQIRCIVRAGKERHLLKNELIGLIALNNKFRLLAEGIDLVHLHPFERDRAKESISINDNLQAEIKILLDPLI